MNELSPAAKQLFEAAKQAYSPSESSLHAVRAALDARLVAEAAALAGGAAGAAGKAALVTKVTWVSLATFAALGTALVVTRTEPRAEPTLAPPAASARAQGVEQAPVPPALASPAGVASAVGGPGPGPAPAQGVAAGAAPAPRALAEPAEPAEPEAPDAIAARAPGAAAPLPPPARARPGARVTSRAAPRAAAPRVSEVSARAEAAQADPEPRSVEPAPTREVPRPDGLRSEVALIGAARSALERGDPAEALALVDAHAARHARGVLAQERLATRVLALCALGRADDARAAARALERLSPRSPHLSRVRASCVAE